MAYRDLNIFEEIDNPNAVINKKLRQYCSSDDSDIIEEGVKTVKKILLENFVRPDEAQKVLSVLRERGSYTVIDRISAKLNIKQDRYEAEFSNLGVREILLDPEYVSKFDRLSTPIRVRKLKPIQVPHIELE